MGSLTTLTSYSFYSEAKLDKGIALDRFPSKLFPDIDFPKDGITGLYGHNSGVGISGVAFDISETLGLELARLEMAVSNQHWTNHNVGFEEGRCLALKDLNVLSLTRVKRDVKSVIVDYWQSYLVGKPPEEDPLFCTEYPHLISKLHKEKEFNHLDLIAYRVKTSLGYVTMATLFNLDAIDQLTIGFGPDDDTPISIPTL
jgi:hypothetical protein